MKKKYAAEALLEMFKNRLAQDWTILFEKEFGEFTGFSSIKQLSVFAKSVHDELERDRKKRGLSNDQSINWQTIYNFFRHGVSENTKDKSLDALAVYLGFRHWNDFVAKEKKNADKDESYISESSNLIKENNKESVSDIETTNLQKTKNNNVILVSSLIIGLVFLGCAFYFYTTRKQLIYIITEATNREFNAYKSVPNIDTTCFDFYTNTPNHYNKVQIWSWLSRRRDSGSRLKMPYSSFQILEFTTKYIGINSALIQTREAWKLHWEGDVNKYDNINTQEYYLIKVNGRWLIQTNAYQGQKTSAE